MYLISFPGSLAHIQARRLGLGGGPKQTVFIDEASCEGKCQAVQDCCDNNCAAPTTIDCYINTGYCDNGGCQAEFDDAEGSNCNCFTLDYGFEMADANEGEGKFS